MAGTILGKLSAKSSLAIVTLFAAMLTGPQARATPAARLVFLGTFKVPTFVTVAPGATNLVFVVERPARSGCCATRYGSTGPFSTSAT
jgi:hypothetical protein